MTTGLLLAAAPRPARAAVSQPTGEMMPVPSTAAEINIATSRGFPADTVTLQGLFNYRGEALEPVRDAHTTPGTFSPMCGFTGRLVLRGGGCHVGFGWYNVTPGSATPPPANEIYLLVPAQLPMCPMPINPAQACCDDTEFCPLAEYNTTQMPQHRWNTPAFTADNIRTDPRYRGGLIGFAMIGDPSTQCGQTKFSQAELNVHSAATPPTNGAPWVTVLVYQSTVDPNAYYLAFEDRPVSVATWRGDGNANDGDFNDFVYFITGLNCEGGGKPCQTGMLGVCAGGTTQCTNGTEIICKPDVPSSPEICDGLDNDCDGLIDQGNPCPGPSQICDRGVCVTQCNDTEFPCAVGLVCDRGYCRDPACSGVNCPDGQICVGGRCQGGCDGAVCPQGQVCRLGRCLDPCAGVTCSSGVCENGVCIPACTCRPCTDNLACAADGRCVEPACKNMTCGAGLVCAGGACVDACAGNTRCPAGQECRAGSCVDSAPRGSGGAVGTLVDAGATGGRGVIDVLRPDAGSPTGSGGNGLTDNGIRRCGCDVGGAPGGVLSLASLALALLVMGRRRRQS